VLASETVSETETVTSDARVFLVPPPAETLTGDDKVMGDDQRPHR
jgi:hypothetical protein